MIIAKIAKARDCGQMRFYAIHASAEGLNGLLKMCHLKPEADALLEVNHTDVVGVLTQWLDPYGAFFKKTACSSLEMPPSLVLKV